MFIKCQEYYMVGSGLLESREIVINTGDISTLHQCGHESRPYSGLQRIIMKNGTKVYVSLSTASIDNIISMIEE